MYCLVCKFKSNILIAAFKVLPLVSCSPKAEAPLAACEHSLDPLWMAVSFFSSPPSQLSCIKWLLPLWALHGWVISIQQSQFFSCSWDDCWLGWAVPPPFIHCLFLMLGFAPPMTLSFWRDVSCHDLCIPGHFVNTMSPTLVTCSVIYWRVITDRLTEWW